MNGVSTKLKLIKYYIKGCISHTLNDKLLKTTRKWMFCLKIFCCAIAVGTFYISSIFLYNYSIPIYFPLKIYKYYWREGIFLLLRLINSICTIALGYFTFSISFCLLYTILYLKVHMKILTGFIKANLNVHVDNHGIIRHRLFFLIHSHIEIMK